LCFVFATAESCCCLLVFLCPPSLDIIFADASLLPRIGGPATPYYLPAWAALSLLSVHSEPLCAVPCRRSQPQLPRCGRSRRCGKQHRRSWSMSDRRHRQARMRPSRAQNKCT
jgi:hypothetical protein